MYNKKEREKNFDSRDSYDANPIIFAFLVAEKLLILLKCNKISTRCNCWTIKRWVASDYGKKFYRER